MQAKLLLRQHPSILVETSIMGKIPQLKAEIESHFNSDSTHEKDTYFLTLKGYQ
jgi:hypothetical protein